MTAGLNNVTVTRKKKIFDDLPSEKQKSYGAVARGNKLFAGFSAKSENVSFPYGVSPIKAYAINGKKAVFCSDGFVREVKDGKLRLLSRERYNNPPEIFSVRLFGKETTAISGGTAGTLCDGRADAFVYPKGEKIRGKGEFRFSFKDRSFTLRKTDDEKSILTPVVQFLTDEEAGKIIDVFPKGKKAYVVCEKQIYALTLGEEITETSLEKVVGGLEVTAGTATATDGKIYFISSDDLCSFDGKTVRRIKEFPKDYEISGSAEDNDGEYVLPVKSGGENMLYVYNAEYDSDYLISPFGSSVAGGGFYCDKESATVGTVGRYGGKFAFVTKPQDFKTAEPKNVTGISLFSDCHVLVCVKGDFGVKTFTAKGGAITIETNLCSRLFVFTVSGEGNAEIKDFTVTYDI